MRPTGIRLALGGFDAIPTDREWRPRKMNSFEAIVLEAAEAVAGATALNAKSPLFGQDGVLDSVGLVSLIVAIEQSVEESHGVTLTLASEKAMSRRSSPFATVGTVVNYLEQL